MFWKMSNSLTLLLIRSNFAHSIQFYSIIPPHYVKPIYKKADMETLRNGPEWETYTHVPVRPALSSDTSSEFHDPITRKFTNYIMRQGKRILARSLLEEAFETIKILQLEAFYNAPPEDREHIILDPKQILHQAVENSTPVLELQKVRRGGITYQVPVPVNANRAVFLSMNWLIEASQEKGNNIKFSDVLAKELIAAAKNVGKVIKRKHDLHKQCEANRAYAHYRWL